MKEERENLEKKRVRGEEIRKKVKEIEGKMKPSEMGKKKNDRPVIETILTSRTPRKESGKGMVGGKLKESDGKGSGSTSLQQHKFRKKVTIPVLFEMGKLGGNQNWRVTNKVVYGGCIKIKTGGVGIR